MPERSSITVDVGVMAQRIFLALSSVIVLLVMTSYACQVAKYVFGHEHVFGLINFLNVDYEDSLPTVFSGAQLVLASLLLLIILFTRITNGSFWTWCILTVGFACMTVDELISLHELVAIGGEPGSMSVPLLERFWVYPAIPVVIAVLLSFIPFLRRLPKSTRNEMALSGCIFVTGAVVIEAVSLAYWGRTGTNASLTYNTMSTLEESFEMFGIALFVRTLLRYIAFHYPTITLNRGEPNTR